MFNSDTKNRISFPAWFLDDWPTPILIQYNLFSSADDKTQPTLVLLYDYRSVHSVPTLIRTVKYKITLQALRKCVGACVRKNVLKYLIINRQNSLEMNKTVRKLLLVQVCELWRFADTLFFFLYIYLKSNIKDLNRQPSHNKARCSHLQVAPALL